VKSGAVPEEIGLFYECKTMGIFSPSIKKPWCAAISRNGRIPALKGDDMGVFESGAVILYLADHYDPGGQVSFMSDTAEYHEMLSWLMF
jgi:glutathione S-transferase